MLLKAEKIISHGDVLFDRNQEEIINIAVHELSEKIITEMFDKKLFKIEMAEKQNEILGTYLSIRMSTRAYNPDD